nr:MFS transporter [Rhodoferax sediminis]
MGPDLERDDVRELASHVLRHALFSRGGRSGVFPGVIFYLTYWFPSERRGRVTGFFMMGAAAAGIIGGPVSTWIMVHMAELHGLHGWQWLFLFEGIPAVILGFVAFSFLSDTPQDAKWLTAREKSIVLDDLAAEEQRAPSPVAPSNPIPLWVS